MLTDIRTALTRKFGPLPAWAWALIAGVGIFVYRSRQAVGTVGSGDTGNGTITDTPATPRDPVVLQPGETAYNPDTGATTTAPGGASTGSPDNSTSPIVVDPGSGVYDPSTHTFYPGQPVSNDDNAPEDTTPTAAAATPSTAASKKTTTLQRATKAITTGKIGPVNTARLKKAGYTSSQIAYHLKRKTPLGKPGKHEPKEKTQHKSGTKVASHTTGKTRTRSKSTVKHPTARPKATTAPPKGKSRTVTATAATHATPSRAKAPVAKAPVIRQRPAPAHTTPRKKK